MSPEPETPHLGDVPRLLEIWLACFNDEHMHEMFPPNEIGDAYLTDALTAYMKEDALAKVYVIRNDQGKRASAADVDGADWANIWRAQASSIRPLLRTARPGRSRSLGRTAGRPLAKA
jgi:hypothetical protein